MALVVGAVTLATILGIVVEPYFSQPDLVMIYMGAVAVVSWRVRFSGSVVAAIGSAVAFNVFLVDPRFALAMSDSRHILTFVMLGAVGMLISSVVRTSRAHERLAMRREAQGIELSRLAGRLAGSRSVEEAAEVAAEQVQALLGAAVVVHRTRDGRLERLAERGGWVEDDTEREAAEVTVSSGQPAGVGAEVVGWARARYLPLRRECRMRGVLGAASPALATDPEARRLLDTAADIVAEVFDRISLDDEARRAAGEAESERTRATFLSSLSHDLRTPLASITGAATALLDRSVRLDPDQQRLLLRQIAEGGQRLDRLFRNVLQLTRLDRPGVHPNLEWHLPEDIVGTAIANVAHLRGERRIGVVPEGSPRLARVDAVLVEQLVTNYLENALQHAPSGPIEVGIGGGDEDVVIEVRDRGPGIPDAVALFEPFVRGPGATPRGAGLGLAICRAVAGVHAGRVWADPRPGGGAIFGVALPRRGPDSQPEPDLAEAEEGP
ncbi:MAG: DUF4118 domain-containing protein [Pseudomonadota bacterium]